MNTSVLEYIQFLRFENKLSESTINSYKTDLMKFSDYLNDNAIEGIQNIHKQDINSYIAYLKTKYSLCTIRRKLSAIKAFCKYLKCVEITDILAAEINALKIPKRKFEPVSRSFAGFVINLPNIYDDTGFRDRLVFEMLYGAGVRVGELISVKLDDIDFDAECIKIRGKYKREVRMYERLRENIADYLKYERTLLLKKCDCEFLLINKNGGGFSRQGIWKLVKRHFDRIPSADGLTPDVLRRSLAVHLLEGGVDRCSIQSFMGYKDKYSLNTYANSVPKRKRYILRLKRKKKLEDVHPRGKLIYNA